MADPKDAALGRPRDLAPLLVPLRIELDESGEWLRWYDTYDWTLPAPGDTAISSDSHREEPVPVQLLNMFAQLDDAPPERIFAFAKRFGPLHLCEKHGGPYTHTASVGRDGRLKSLCAVAQVPGREGWLQEPIAGWRRIAESMRTCLDGAAMLTRTRHLDDDEVLGQLHRLESTVNFWLACGAIRPVLSVWGGPATVILKPLGLLGTLALQLADAASRQPGLAICSGCGEHFTPRRRPRPGLRRYCDPCKEKNIDGRDSQRAYRRRKRATRSP